MSVGGNRSGRRWFLPAVAVGLLVWGCGGDDGDVPEGGFDVGDCLTDAEEPEKVDCSSPDAAGQVVAEAGLLGDVEECPPETDSSSRSSRRPVPGRAAPTTASKSSKVDGSPRRFSNSSSQAGGGPPGRRPS